MQKKAFKTFLKQLAIVLEFDTLKPDKHGACLIIMKGSEVPLLFEYDEKVAPHTVLVSSPICGIPPGKIEEVLELSLHGNATQEETLSCKVDEEVIYLHRRFNPTIQSAELYVLIDAFVAKVLLWKEKLGNDSPQEEGKIPPSGLKV
ncbi:MAG: hypothetical protein S4CHLAM45_15100 [Chlamydiales bacterium]|nr:hypothetical protein [Chlamydiales bacterium]MCH9620127.1 hypothetical protein [Chlamydiales bacterium]MCH9623597.1 hypothetical protein [Chlamydiales bacterium]